VAIVDRPISSGGSRKAVRRAAKGAVTSKRGQDRACLVPMGRSRP
jgi:hypothetical protein